MAKASRGNKKKARELKNKLIKKWVSGIFFLFFLKLDVDIVFNAPYYIFYLYSLYFIYIYFLPLFYL